MTPKQVREWIEELAWDAAEVVPHYRSKFDVREEIREALKKAYKLGRKVEREKKR